MGKTIRLHVDRYSGKNPRKALQSLGDREAADRISQYLNERITDEPRTFTFGDIASDLNYPKELVARILKHNGYGSNGITI